MGSEAPDAADLADLVLAFDADEAIAAQTLRDRDAAIGRELGAPDGRRALDRVLGWLEVRRETDLGGRSSREALQLAGAGSLLLGALIGAMAAAGALAFDGASGRINVVWVLGLFVGLQALTIGLTALAFLPGAVRAALPGLGGLGLLRRVAVRPLALRWVPAPARHQVEALLGRGRAARNLLGEVQRWLVLCWSQSFSTGFNLGVLASLALLVVLTDLAFGWSTTLEVDASRVYAAVRVFAAPWAWGWPAAVPSMELLEATRYFRVNSGAPPAIDPAVFGRFWPFLFAAIACYGLLPRILLRLVAGARLRTAVREAIELHPEVPRLLGRLDPRQVETRAEEAERSGEPDTGTSPSLRAMPERAFVIDWSDALDASGAEAIGLGAAPVAPAGGACTLAEDVETIEAASRTEDSILVVVRGYEAPVLDLRDFLGELRVSLGRGRSILLLPRGADDEAAIRWARWLAPLGDPWLELVSEGRRDV